MATSNVQWHNRAACKGKPLSLFFGPGEFADKETQHQKERREEEAGQVCANCPVRSECLDWHLDFGAAQYGFAAGMNEDDRANFRRKLLRRTRDERRTS
ncbi:WhiB family transcriptional regulator [Sphaerisporangium viridialbum]|uniref:WhiB family transcriptional regulator n=1 Tax=Sphaerisporangium viridialbum TaxID=46189 RepID=UPI003C77BB84